MFQWDATTMPRPLLAWGSMATSLVISLLVFAIGITDGWHTLAFREAQGLGQIPAVAIAAITAYVSVKSDRKAFARQHAFRAFGLLTLAACFVYWI